MKVPLLKEAIDKYANAIQRAPILKEAYWATIQENFQANWDVKATDFYQMYDQSLESSSLGAGGMPKTMNPKR
jgi:hypothetical protein